MTNDERQPPTFVVTLWTRYEDGWRGGSTTSFIRDEQRARDLFAEEKGRGAARWEHRLPFLDHGPPVAWGVSLWREGGASPLDLFGHSTIPTKETAR